MTIAKLSDARMILVFLLILVTLVTGKASAQSPRYRLPTRSSDLRTAGYRDDLTSFQRWANSYVRGPHHSVFIPNADRWFKDHFYAQAAQMLLREYRGIERNSAGLLAAIKKARSKGRTRVRVSRVASTIDMQANGLQNAALQRMRKRVPLYTLRLVEPGQSSGTSLWSFVFVNGQFKYLGKMNALNPTRGDLVTDLLCQMPLGKMESLLREKGLLHTSAVTYLRRKGVLN